MASRDLGSSGRAPDHALGLGRRRVNDPYTQKIHHIAPLGLDIVRLQGMIVPNAVLALHHAEDPRAVDVPAQADAEGLNYGSASLNISPRGLAEEGIDEKQQPSVVINGGDEGPLLRGVGNPRVGGVVLLDEGEV